jgi:hypothetical protein
MLVNSFIHTNLLLITKRYGKLIKKILIKWINDDFIQMINETPYEIYSHSYLL